MMNSSLGRRRFLKAGGLALLSPLLIRMFNLAPVQKANAATKTSIAAYNRAIDKIVEGFKAGALKVFGWRTSRRGSPMVTAKALVKYASSSIESNSFWLDERYAAGTRWGGLLAFPMFSPGASNPLKLSKCNYMAASLSPSKQPSVMAMPMLMPASGV